MNRPRATSWIRVDLGDYLASQRLGMREAQRTLKSLTIPHPTPAAGVALDGFILQGFAISAIAGPPDTISVALGTSARAILSEAADATVYHGVMAEDELGAATVTVPVANFWGGVPGVYSIYIRFVTQPGNSGNRMFWSPSTASEYLNNQPTTDQPRFEIDGVAAGLPLGWTTCYKLGEVTLDAAGTVTLIAGMRNFLFEGHEDATPAYEPAWGDGANDRNANRASFGVHDLATFVQYTRRQVRDILGATQNPWSAVNGALPSLTSLNTDHWYEGIGAPAEGHHRATVELVSMAPGSPPSLILRPAAATGWPVIWLTQYPDELYFERLGVVGPQILLKAPANPDPGGIGISGPSSGSADLAVGEEAHLRFGSLSAAPWTSSSDAAFVAENNAVYGRMLRFEFNAGQVARLTNGGNFHVIGDLQAAGNCQAVGEHTFLPVKTNYRSMGPADFRPTNGGAVVGGAVYVFGQDIPTVQGAALNDVWQHIILDGTGAPIPLDGGWAVLNPVTAQISTSDLACSARLTGSAAWLPNQAETVAGDTIFIKYETTAAWLAAQRISIALCAWDNLGHVLRVISYAYLTPAAGAAGPLVAGVVWVDGPDHAAINHTLYRYFFNIMADDPAAPPVVYAGTIGIHSISVPFRYGTLRH